MIAGKKIISSLLARPNHFPPLPLLFVSVEKVIFRQAKWGPGVHAGACQGSSLKGQENGICVTQSIVDLKWYRQVGHYCSMLPSKARKQALWNCSRQR